VEAETLRLLVADRGRGGRRALRRPWWKSDLSRRHCRLAEIERPASAGPAPGCASRGVDGGSGRLDVRTCGGPVTGGVPPTPGSATTEQAGDRAALRRKRRWPPSPLHLQIVLRPGRQFRRVQSFAFVDASTRSPGTSGRAPTSRRVRRMNAGAGWCARRPLDYGRPSGSSSRTTGRLSPSHVIVTGDARSNYRDPTWPLCTGSPRASRPVLAEPERSGPGTRGLDPQHYGVCDGVYEVRTLRQLALRGAGRASNTRVARRCPERPLPSVGIAR